MSISDELQKLDMLRQNGVLSSEEFETAKRRILADSTPTLAVEQLEEIKAQNELAQLDREWTMEREKFMVVGRNGRTYIPGRFSSFFGGLFVVGFGIFWTIIASSLTSSGITSPGQMGIFSLFPLFGIIFILFGAGLFANAFIKAGQYDAAEKRYQQSRLELLNKMQGTQSHVRN